MGVRRYSCFLLLVGLAVYTFGGLFLLFGKSGFKKTSSFWDAEHKANQRRSFRDPNYSKQPSSYSIIPPNLPYENTYELPLATNKTERQAAAFIVLVRNSELPGLVQSMHDVESRFNHKFNYPWVFLNDEPFTLDFVKYTTEKSSGKTHYGLVDKSMWGYPDFIDQKKAAQMREKMKDLPYGKSESYRHMCRFQSGFFWRHPLILSLNLEYYWRVEPYVRYFCDLDYDPFLYMKQNKKKYGKVLGIDGRGFNISFKEHSGTIPSLWRTVKDFAISETKNGTNHFPNLITESIFPFISPNDGNTYNGCHFWTNFEIARLDLWHTTAYQRFFNFLDKKGGFFYERWGDAPVHSIFAALFLKRDEIHFFNDIGYKHSIYSHCPAEDNLLSRCSCNPESSLDFTDNMSCLTDYTRAINYNEESDKRTVNELLLNN